MSNVDIRGKFVWHELMTTDTDAAGDFYSRVVPWKTQDSGMPSYTMWMAGKYRAAGLMALPEEGDSATPPHWIIYIGTPDVDATVAAAEKLGGRVIKGASDIPNVGRFAVLADPQGAAFAVFAPLPSSGSEASPGGGVGDFTWHELATMDPDSALRFYSELFGWSKGAAHDMGDMGTYQIVSHGGQDTAGIYKARDNSTPPSWLSYARVTDAGKAASAAKAAGGRILNGPMEVPGGSWIVMMLDPQGGAFAVVEAPRTAKASAEKSAGRMSNEDSSPAAMKQTAVKKTATSQTASSKTATSKTASSKTTTSKTAANQSAARKTTAKKETSPKKTVAAKAASKKAAAKKTASSKKSNSAAKTAAARKTVKKKGSAAKKSTTAKRGPARKAAKRKAKARK